MLVLGGYGAFGQRAAERLAGVDGIELLLAGRSLERAKQAAAAVGRTARAAVTPLRLDAETVTTTDLDALRPALVINASGPFQSQGYGLARAAIAARCHYIDLADARAHAVDIAALDAEARRAGVLVVSGASTVPALSTAVVDACAPHFARLDAVTITISPGNSFDPGLATTRSILGTLGRPIAPAATRSATPIRGWQPLERHILPHLGPRWTGACDAPDLEVLPHRYPTLREVRVLAALEVGSFHLGLWGLSWLVRAGLLRHPEKVAQPLLALKHRLHRLGSDRGGMAVTLEGIGADAAPKRIDWWLIARRGHGPYIPATPAVILAKHLLAGTQPQRGATACVGLLTLSDFLAEVADLDITAGTA